ncbi:hypothetical protein PCANC_13920 [Puccinia coronata f. sp. avenae]|uniref:Uncharacterized protein n=1 Tax=Puccinia coronata f. sp. avenae TaxID=200324 RepID=A0A2N5VIF1_9BASI|nr:hypothetical protein PCANC_13920 [Puccinia coronata f. sp. avenae]PLW49765.1 hypothetical protein PCASD_01620 [Puccinia coronata f. sp. avenae]
MAGTKRKREDEGDTTRLPPGKKFRRDPPLKSLLKPPDAPAAGKRVSFAPLPPPHQPRRSRRVIPLPPPPPSGTVASTSK